MRSVSSLLLACPLPSQSVPPLLLPISHNLSDFPVGSHSLPIAIDGSTDRCCIAIVTNERALLSGSDQPVQNLERHRILCILEGARASTGL